MTKFEKSEPRSEKPIEGTVILPNPSVFFSLLSSIYYYEYAKKRETIYRNRIISHDVCPHIYFIVDKYLYIRGSTRKKKKKTKEEEEEEAHVI